MSQQSPWREDPAADACMRWAESFTKSFSSFQGLSLQEQAVMAGGIEAGLRMGLALALIDRDWARGAFTALDRESAAAAGLQSDARAESSRRFNTWQTAESIINSSR